MKNPRFLKPVDFYVPKHFVHCGIFATQSWKQRSAQMAKLTMNIFAESLLAWTRTGKPFEEIHKNIAELF